MAQSIFWQVAARLRADSQSPSASPQSRLADGTATVRVTASFHHRSRGYGPDWLAQEAEGCRCRCVLDKFPPLSQRRIQHILYLLHYFLFYLLHCPDKASTTPRNQRRIQHILNLLHYLVSYLLHNPRAAANLRLHAVLARYRYANYYLQAVLARYCYANLHLRAVLASCGRE